MDEGKFVADFLSANIDKIINIGTEAVGKANQKFQIQLKTAYRNYLLNTRNKYSKSKSFFIRDQPVDLYTYYVPTGVSCRDTVFANPLSSDLVSHNKRVVIMGTGGCGKSVLMRHLYLNCIENKQYTPVLIELRDLNNEPQTLDSKIEDTLETYGFNISGDYVRLAMKEGHFCFYLDGYDEVNPSLRKKLIAQIKKIANSFPKCPIVISSRPDEVFEGIEDFSVFTVIPLDLSSATELIKKLPFDEEIKQKFISDLESGLFEKHESFLSNPLLLSIMLLTYGENAEIPSKLSIFYNQAFEALFQRHDANKGGYKRTRLTNLDIQDFARVFSLFALQTYEKRLFKMPRTDCLAFISKARDSLHLSFDSEAYLNDLLTAACLLIEEGLEIAFSHRSFQEYFVALNISNASPVIQEKLINRYWENMNMDNVILLLDEINPDLVERILIIPVLENMFKEIGVRRKVGITHAAKYLKRVYKSLNVAENGFSASMEGTRAAESPIVHIAVKKCNSYKRPDSSYFKKHISRMRKKYGVKDERVEFKTKSLTYKSPVMQDTLNGKSVFSIVYLQAAFDAYKELKSKHKNQSNNLNALLGIG